MSPVAVAQALSLAACGGGSTASPEDGAAPDATVVSASAVIGPAGGIVRLGQASITIPPGALAQDATITIVLRSDLPPSTYLTYSPLYEFDPSGLSFAVPAVVELPEFGAPPSTSSIFWSTPSGTGYQPLATFHRASGANAQVQHFSTGFVGGDDLGEARRFDRARRDRAEVRMRVGVPSVA